MKSNIDSIIVYDLYYNKKLSLKNVGLHFNVGPDAIRSILKRNNWKPRKPSNKKVDQQELIDLYLSGINGPKLANKFNVNVSYVYKVLHANDIDIKKGERNRKHSLNENFFNEWSPLMAYWLGMLCADGHLNKSNSMLSLCMKDIEHLELFAKDLNSDYKVQFHIRGENSYSPGTARTFININSSFIKKKLIKLEFYDFKNGGIKLINKIPENLFNHWLRGMTDGDGTISIINEDKKQYPTWRLVGPHEEQLKIIGHKISRLANITCLNVYKSKSIYVITCKKNKCIKLLKYLYKNNIQSLKRKREKFEIIRSQF